ncbi:MAG: hypothetical protein ACT4PZ_16585 [Panacagrimonas sp.]
MTSTIETDKIQGEGDYEAARRYDEKAHEFAKSGKVGPAAEAAKPHGAAEEKEMADAEAQGRSRSKGEDPALSKGTARKSA